MAKKTVNPLSALYLQSLNRIQRSYQSELFNKKFLQKILYKCTVLTVLQRIAVYVYQWSVSILVTAYSP